VEKFEVREEHWTEGIFLERAKAIIGDGPLDVVRYQDDMDIWIDDEGLLKNPRRFTAWEGRPRHTQGVQLAGNLVITGGADANGDTLGTDISIAELVNKFVFMVYPEGSENIPEPQMGFTVITHQDDPL
jgi:hypothetical protein